MRRAQNFYWDIQSHDHDVSEKGDKFDGALGFRWTEERSLSEL